MHNNQMLMKKKWKKYTRGNVKAKLLQCFEVGNNAEEEEMEGGSGGGVEREEWRIRDGRRKDILIVNNA